MSNLTSSLTIKLVDDVSKPARTVSQALKDAERNAKSVARALNGTGATNRLQASLSKLSLSAKDIEKVAGAWKDYARSAGLASNASQWTKAQLADVRRWETQTVAALRKVTAEQRRFAAATAAAGAPAKGGKGGAHDGLNRLSVAKPIAAAVTAHAAVHAAHNVIEKYGEADKTLRYQGAMSDLTEAEMASRYKQAITMGPAKGLKPEDILHGQQKLAGRGVKKQFVEPFTAELAEYARAMQTDVASAAKTLETIVFATNQHIEDSATAGKVMRRQIDMAVKAAKVGGLDDNAIQLGSKMGSAAGHAGGFRNETIFGLMAALSRAGYGGEEAGTATRGIISKLVSPTRQGLDALDAMGVNYNQFTKMPGGMNYENLEPMMKRRFGKALTASQKSRLDAVMLNPDTVADRDEFITQVSSILADSFEKKKGKTKAQDAQKIAKLVGDFYKLGTEGVDTEGLLNAILEKNPSLQLLNKLFTTEHGSKVGALAQNLDRFKEIIDAISHVPEGFAKEIGDKTMGGVAGSIAQLSAQTEAMTISVGKANEALIQFSAKLLTATEKKITDAPDIVKQTATVGGGIGIAAATGAAVKAWLTGSTVREIILGGLKLGARGTLPTMVLSGIPMVLDHAAERGAMAGSVPEAPDRDAPVVPPKPWQVGPSMLPGGKGPLQLPMPTDENMASFRHAVDDLAQLNAKPTVDTSSIEAVKPKADEAKTSVDALNTTANPVVSTSSLDSFIAKCREAQSAFAALSAAAAKGLQMPGVGSLGKVQRGHFSTAGVQGE